MGILTRRSMGGTKVLGQLWLHSCLSAPFETNKGLYGVLGSQTTATDIPLHLGPGGAELNGKSDGCAHIIFPRGAG